MLFYILCGFVVFIPRHTKRGYPATQTVAGYYVILSEPFQCPSVLPSVRPSAFRFRALTLVFLTDFLQTLHRH